MFNQDRDMVATAYLAPSSDVEEMLVEIWQDILNIPRIGVQDNFFDLGGHSLPAIRITSRIEDSYEMTMPIDVFFAKLSFDFFKLHYIFNTSVKKSPGISRRLTFIRKPIKKCARINATQSYTFGIKIKISRRIPYSFPY